MKNIIAVFVVALFNLGTYAQLPHYPKQKDLKTAREEARLEYISGSGQALRPIFRPEPEPQTSNLKSQAVPVNVQERLDSLYDYIYNIDSARWQLDDIDYYYYDNMGMNSMYLSKSWNIPLQMMVYSDRTDVLWNTNRQMILMSNYQWVDTSAAWRPWYRNNLAYDLNGNQTVSIYSDWDMIKGTWKPMQIDSTIITDDKLVSEVRYYGWDDDSVKWLYYEKEKYLYDGNNQLTKIEGYNWNYGMMDFYQNRYTEFFYDAEGRDTLYADWHFNGEVWTEEYRSRTEYDANGRVILEEDYSWEVGSGEMLGSWKREYGYDAGNLVYIIDYDFDRFGSMEWFIYEKEEYTWDGNGNKTEELIFSFDTAQAEYIPLEKDAWEYDLGVTFDQVAMPYMWYLFYFQDMYSVFHNKVTKYTSLEWVADTVGGGSYDTVSYEDIYYSGFNYTNVEDLVSCKADFNWNINLDNPLKIAFADASDTTIVAWYWMFGDGESTTSQHPVHSYSRPGTYKVFLTTTDQTGNCTNTMMKNVVVGNPACNAAFTYTIDTTSRQLTLTNVSQGSDLNYFWSFGDGSMSHSVSPAYTYPHPGSYPVTLTVASSDGTCMDSYTQTIRAGSVVCNADFAVFIDSTTNMVSFRAKDAIRDNRYTWVLGDGMVTNAASFSHSFKSPGYYSISLTVYNEESGCVETRAENILVGKRNDGGMADFMYLSKEGNEVSFTNKSIGYGLTYIWDFNDGDTSSFKDPQHTYAVGGYYDVCLTVFSEGYQNTYCDKIFAGQSTTDECLAGFEYALSDDGLEITCMDRSIGSPDTWAWLYNGGSPTSQQNPVWTTASPGIVLVHQNISNSLNNCSSDAFALVNMGADAGLEAGFGYVFRKGNIKADTYPVDFIGVSIGDAGKLKWDFGDGTYDSTSVNPSHTYASPGTYNACLTITNTTTGDESTNCQEIHIYAASAGDLLSPDGSLKAYPNPFSENTQVEIGLNETTAFELAVFDLLGRKVNTLARDWKTKGTYTYTLDGGGLEPGNYFLILDTGSKRSRMIISIIK